MARKKKTEAGTASRAEEQQATSAATATAAAAPARPEYIDGPPVHEDGSIVQSGNGNNYGNPYKAVVTTQVFEMGEDRRFKQRVFKFKDRPADEIIARLKDAGFTYRPQEKAWTITANAETRVMTDRLAQELAGPEAGLSR